MKVKIDKVGRVYLPKMYIKNIGIKTPCEVNVEYNTNNHTILLKLDNTYTIKDMINKRLKYRITSSEKTFLKELLELCEVNNDKD